MAKAVDFQEPAVAYFALRKIGLDPKAFFVFDGTLGWIPHAYLVGKNLIENEQIDCILASYAPPSNLMLATMLSKACKIPFVVDYRDAWNSWSGIEYPSGMHRRLEMWLERKVLVSSDGIVMASGTIKDKLVAQFPIVKDKKMAIVRNGFFEGVLKAEAHVFAERKISFLHAGSIHHTKQIRQATSFLDGIATLSSDLLDNLDVILAGRVSRQIVQHVRERNLDSVVRFMGNMPRRKVWSYMKGVDYLLCFPDTDEGVITKMYEYLAARKPIINVGGEDGGEIACLIAEYGVGSTVRDEPSEIARLLKRLIRRPLRIKRIGNLSPFSRESQTRRLAALLNEVIKGQRRNG